MPAIERKGRYLSIDHKYVVTVRTFLNEPEILESRGDNRNHQTGLKLE